MPVAEFATVADARRGFKTMLDTAEVGGAGLVHRGEEMFVLVSADTVRPALQAALRITPEVFFEDDGVGIALPGAPFAAEGSTLEEASADLVDALREYAQDWPRLRHAPNHRHNGTLVALVDVSTDEQLREWVTGASS